MEKDSPNLAKVSETQYPTIISSLDTEFSADSVEYCPFSSFSSLFVIGTYQVTEHENAFKSIPAEPSLDDNSLSNPVSEEQDDDGISHLLDLIELII